jgi:lambda family phage tail tape measure protein
MSSSNNSTIVFSVDATGVEAGVNKIKAGSATVNTAMDAMAKKAALVDKAMQEAAANGFELNARAANKLASDYIRLEAAAGKTQAQMLAQKAAATGVTSTFSGMASQIEDASKKVHGFSFATAASKRELLVLGHELSQGNYKKFGGSLMVLAEQTGAAGLLFSGLGVAALAGAAALAGVAYEAYKGYEAFEALNRSINATSGYTGLTSSQMSDLSKSLAGVSGNVADTEQIMASLVASGAIAGDSLAASTAAVANFAKQTGMSAEDATQAMVKFAEDPAKALEVLVTKYHEFDGAQVAIIQKYLDAGDKAGAYAKEVEFINDAHAKFGKEGVDNVGYVAAAWAYLAKTAHGAMNELNAFGAATSDSAKLADAVERQAVAQKTLSDAQAHAPNRVEYAQAELAAANAEIANIKRVTDANVAAQKANAERAAGGQAELNTSAFLKKYKSTAPGDVRDQEKSEAKTAFDALSKDSPSYQQALIAYHERNKEIDDKYTKATKTRTPSNNSAINSQLADLMGQNKLIEQEEKRSEQTLKAQRDAGLVDSSQYLQQLHDLQAGALTKEIALAQQRADVAGGKKDKATQTTALAQVKEYNAQRTALDQTLQQDLAKVDAQRSSDIQKFADAQGESLRSQQAAIQHASATMFMDPVAKANSEAAFALSQNYYKAQEQLRAQYDSPTADQEVYAAKLADLDTYHKAALDLLQASQAQQFAVRSSYSDQIKLAMTQSMGDSQTNAQLMGTAFSSAYSTMSSQLETFITTGKGSWASFTESIIADFAKIALKAAEQQVFSSVMSGVSMFSTGGAVGSYADGGSIVGAGTGTSDSIPAMLSNGEYVLQASAVKKYGSLLDAMNNGTAHFASGGAVGTVAPSSGGSNTNLSLSLSAGNSGMTQADLAAIAPHIQTLIDKRMNQRMSQQGGFADLIRQGKI